MTLKEFAEKLDGTTDYPCMSKEIRALAKENGIVILHGCSDDLAEFEGAYFEEVGCFDGGTISFDKNGVSDDGEEHANKIKVFWCGQCENEKRPYEATWEYETAIPHEVFRMYDEDEFYCKGIVFYLKDCEGMK